MSHFSVLALYCVRFEFVLLFLRRSSASIFVDRDLLDDCLRFDLDERRRRRPKPSSILTNFFEVILPSALDDPRGWRAEMVRRFFFSRTSRDEVIDYLSRHYPQWNSFDVPRPIPTDRTSLLVVQDLIEIHDPDLRPKAVRPRPTLPKVFRRTLIFRGRLSLPILPNKHEA